MDARIDLNGEIMIAKEVDSGRTTPITLQWMVMACDPSSVERETCDELPVNYKTTITKWAFAKILCNKMSNFKNLQ